MANPVGFRFRGRAIPIKRQVSIRAIRPKKRPPRTATPSPEYSSVSEALRRAAPSALQCALFCGGARCKYEHADSWDPKQLAVQGVYSHWITKDLMAMARPSTAAIAARNIIQQFHSWGVKTVVNLQTPGEHASCGPPLQSSGFTYDPTIFMENNIYFYNFAWKDYGEASLSGLLDMVKVLAFSVKEGRVAVHCHAGLGRTGVLIACYLVHSMRVRANDAIRLVRRRRPRAVQTKRQILCVQQFEHYILPFTNVFSIKEAEFLAIGEVKRTEFNLRQHLHRQRVLLHGLEERVFQYLPKIVYVLCERLLKMCKCDDIYDLDYRIRSVPFTRKFLTQRYRQAVSEDASSPEATPRENIGDIVLRMESLMHEIGDEDLRPTRWKWHTKKGASYKATYIAQAIIADHSSLPENIKKHIKSLQYDVNNKCDGVDKIQSEDNILALSAMLLEWLEALKTPVLDAKDLSVVIAKRDQLEVCIRKLQYEDLILLEYLIRFTIRLRPIPALLRRCILRRFLAALTQQSVKINGVHLPNKKEYTHLREGTSALVLEFFQKLTTELESEIAGSAIDNRDVVIGGCFRKSKERRKRQCCIDKENARN